MIMNISIFSAQLHRLSEDYANQRISAEDYRNQRKIILDEIDICINGEQLFAKNSSVTTDSAS